MNQAADDLPDGLPFGVADYLQSMIATKVEPDCSVAKRLIAAPCSRNAFTIASARLTKTPGYKICKEVHGAIPERLIADIATQVACFDFAGMRKAASAASKRTSEIADHSRRCRIAFDGLMELYRSPSIRTDAIATLVELDVELFEKTGIGLLGMLTRIEGACTEGSSKPAAIFSELDGTFDGRKLHKLEYYVVAFDTRIEQSIVKNYLPAGFRLSHAEMAGIAWAALGYRGTSPISQRNDDKDNRAERVRSIRRNNKDE